MEPAAPVAAPAAPAAPAAAPEAPAAPMVGDTASPAPEAPQPERTFSQKELDEILEKRLGKERRKREDIERRLRITEELHLKGRDSAQPQQPQAQQPQGPAEPKREQFDTYEAFIEARADWRAEQAVERRITERDKKAQEETQRQKEAETAEQFRKRVKESAKGLDDFDDVIAEATRDPSQPVARLYADALEAADAPARVLYELAKNPDEAERIAALPLARQAREIWLLDSKLKQQPTAPQRSNAPAPIEPVGGKSRAATDEITGNETGDEYKRKREVQLRKQMGR